MLLFSAETVQELSKNLTNAINVVKNTDHSLVAAISSGCELCLRFIPSSSQIAVSIHLASFTFFITTKLISHYICGTC